MLTTIQRDAISRAQSGDFELADAMELACDERQTFVHRGGEYDLLFGIWEGGRLRRLAYGSELPDENEEPDEVFETVSLIVDLNGSVLLCASFEDDEPEDPALYSSCERTPIWARRVLSEYHAGISKPTQLSLIEESA